MAKHLLFLRWWVIVCSTTIAGYFAHKLGAFSEILKQDWTYISPTIFCLFVFVSLWCGIKTFILSYHIDNKITNFQYDGCIQKTQNIVDPQKIINTKIQEDVGWFAADSFQTMGFIGTVCGMIYALKGFAGIDLADINAIQALVSNLVAGVSVAFYTTLSGLIASFLIKIQYFNLSYARKRVNQQ